MTENKIQIINGTTYKITEVNILGNTWTIMQATGKSNYINVCKVTNNPLSCVGKFFKSWDEACQAYKSGEMKTALLMAEINFKD